MSSVVKWILYAVGAIVIVGVGIMGYGYYKRGKEAKNAQAPAAKA